MTLDGLRGVAALIVALFHFEGRWGETVLAGYLAVDLFFIMSGFVISASYTERMREGLGFLGFSRLRLVRLLPLYYIGLGLGLAKQVVGLLLGLQGIPINELACDALFGAAVLPSPCSDYLFPINAPAWSLFLELLASAAFALGLWRIKGPWLAALTGAVAAVLMLIVRSPDYFDMGWQWISLGGGVARTIFSFCLGMALQRLFKPEWRRESWLSLLPLALTAAAMVKPPLVLPRAAVEQALVLLVFPAVLAMACRWDPPGILRRPFDLLGEISYPAYAIHWTVVSIVMIGTDRLRLSQGPATVVFLLVLVPCAFSAGYIDRMVRQFLRRRSYQPTLEIAA